jgi:hypothetical protein
MRTKFSFYSRYKLKIACTLTDYPTYFIFWHERAHFQRTWLATMFYYTGCNIPSKCIYNTRSLEYTEFGNKKFARVIQSQTSGNNSATGSYGTLRSGGETNVFGRSPLRKHFLKLTRHHKCNDSNRRSFE